MSSSNSEATHSGSVGEILQYVVEESINPDSRFAIEVDSLFSRMDSLVNSIQFLRANIRVQDR